MSDRRQQQVGGQRRLEALRQKRNALRSRGEEVRAWAGGPAGYTPRGGGVPDAAGAPLAAAQRRRQQQQQSQPQRRYALTSSSSSSDAEEEEGGEGEGNTSASLAPPPVEASAKLFAKLGLKGFESDSSWASSPESSRIKAVVGGISGPPSVNKGGSKGASSSSSKEAGREGQLGAELRSAHSTIAALQQELAAARAQADHTTAQLREVEGYAQQLQARLHATEQELAGARSGAAAHAAAAATAAAAPADHAEDPRHLAAVNSQLQQQVAELGGQLALATAWQQEVHSMQEQLGAMEQAVAESEAAHLQQEAELAALLQQREAELMSASARLAAAEAQLAVLQAEGAAGSHHQLLPSAELLAEFALNHAHLTAALSEAAALLA